MRSAAGGFEPDEKINLPACLHPDEVARRAVASLRPRIAQVAITSTPLNNDEYQPGEALRVTVAFHLTSGGRYFRGCAGVEPDHWASEASGHIRIWVTTPVS